MNMANAVIQKYLNQSVHNYDEGRVLFEKFCEDEVLKLLFRTGSSSYHHRRLFAELEKLATVAPPVITKQENQVARPTIPSLEEFTVPNKPYKEDEYQSFPAQIQEVVRRKNMHYKRAQHLFVEIGFTEDKEKRLEMALVLLNDHEQVNACWATIDEYRETGAILVEKTKTIEDEISEISEVNLNKTLNNVRANISKDKKKLDSLPDGHRKAKVLLRYQANLVKQKLLIDKIGGLNE